MNATTPTHIVIDIGHARGTGARGCGAEEHDRCEIIAGHLAAALRAIGYTVSVLDYPDRSNTADLVATATAANRITTATCGISLHMDAASRPVDNTATSGNTWNEPDPAPHGAHVCYLSPTGERIAAAVARELCALLPGRAQPTVQRRDLYILKHTRAPWVLCECGFITNPQDAATDPAVVAAAIAAGLRRYLEQA